MKWKMKKKAINSSNNYRLLTVWPPIPLIITIIMVIQSIDPSYVNGWLVRRSPVPHCHYFLFSLLSFPFPRFPVRVRVHRAETDTSHHTIAYRATGWRIGEWPFWRTHYSTFTTRYDFRVGMIWYDRARTCSMLHASCSMLHALVSGRGRPSSKKPSQAPRLSIYPKHDKGSSFSFLPFPVSPFPVLDFWVFCLIWFRRRNRVGHHAVAPTQF